jgi:hypothetical protein
MVIAYVGIFLYSQSWLNHRKRLNINHLVNARDFNGEVILNLILKFYPHKVNIEKYRSILMEKYENQILKINDLEMQVFHRPEYIKLQNESAVEKYIQETPGF